MKIETLNIQGGWKIDEINQEILDKLVPFDLLSLQEVKKVDGIDHADIILSGLGRGYKAIKWHPTTFAKDKYGRMGNAIFYNTDFNLVSQKFIKIPDYEPNIFWKVMRFYFIPIQRLALSAVFKKDSHLIRITNVHLEYSGGQKVRHKQIEYLLGILEKESVNTDIVLGDFNTLGVIDKRMPELGVFFENGFKLASKSIKFTAGADSPDPNWFATSWIQFAKKLGFDLRQNLDHVLVKGEVETKCKKVKINSSDHDAVVCEIDFR